MARVKTNATYNEIKEHKIFLIIHKETFTFFVGATSSDLSSVFSRHYSMHETDTKDLFKEYRETIYAPQMFILQTINCTLSEARTRQIAFIKYFKERGYSPLNKDYIVDWSKDLNEYTKEIYNEISNKYIEEYIAEANHIMLNYGRKRSEVNKNKYDEGKKQICIRVSEEEYNIIKAQADRNNLTLTAYISQVALQGNVINLNYNPIIEHTKEIGKLKNLIKLVVELFSQTKEIYDSDIERIIELMKSIDESDKKLLQGFLKHTENVRSIIRKELKKLL